uniref:DNA polymerase n=1 Tax=Streptomyces phage Scarif TaxID=3158858 RepID=A0AAU7GY88_9CAUD
MEDAAKELDFFRICVRESRKKNGPVEVYADYIVGRSKDLMIQGGGFYAVWNEALGLWSRQEYDVQVIVDQAIREAADKLRADGIECEPKYLSSFDTDRWAKFKKFMKNAPDNSHPLDTKVVFADTEVKKTDYASRRLPYSMGEGDISAYEELVSRLYDEEERKKFEWAIGAIIAGDAKRIQKFLVFFGSHGTGKSTIMEIIGKLFGGKVKDGGYVAFFEAEALTGTSNAFSTEAFKDNPLVAIQHDSDLSKIETNARLNSIVSHEDMKINEKYKAQYDTKINAFLFIGTNKPVQITDAKSGLIRRLIDVHPTGNTFKPEDYYTLISRVDFELGAIAHHCLQVYRKMGKSAYSGYKPEVMMRKTDVFYNFVEHHFDIFKAQDGTTLKQAWALYKEYCAEAELQYKLTLIKFREALMDYFEVFLDRDNSAPGQPRSVYKGFTGKQFKTPVPSSEPKDMAFKLVLEETESLLDEMYAGYPAQYANTAGNPKLYWDDSERIDPKTGEPFIPKPSQVVSTTLGDLNTSRLHFLQVPEYHIWIDFDLTDENGEKSREKNLEAAASWPPTYAEFSKSGKGVHLHYIYDGDTSDLASVYSEGIEIKVCRGNSSLRRKLTKCNDVAVATLKQGSLPLKEKPVLNPNSLRNEDYLRRMIVKALRREIGNGATKPSIDFIKKLLDEAQQAGYPYDVTDLRQKVAVFAANSTNQSDYCIKAVARMQWKSSEEALEAASVEPVQTPDDRLVFFDCEVYPNLFAICWKYHGSPTVVKMLNPTPGEVENLLFNFKLVGYNNRGYDNHILWARMMGASNEQLYRLSKRIIDEKDENARYGEAWNASYADVLDYLSVKESLKWWEIELGIPHVEMDIPWDQPVPDEKIQQVLDYCANDVNALEAVFEANKQDFVARQILADLSGLTVNHSTRQHVMRILFGKERNPQGQFVYTDLSEQFPGYKFDKYAKVDKSTYRGISVGEGGLVYAEPGIHENVALLDVASMHPTSIVRLNLFGPYTENFARIMDARLALKHGDKKRFEELLPGVPWPETKEETKALSNALKLVINSTYGYTCAKFANPARDPRNIDNIVAKRGALFMVDLLHAVQEQGFTVAHIKTDSIKIPNATPEIIQFVKDFGEKYGYTFEHEATYDRMCLVNDAVYVAYKKWDAEGNAEGWTATGAEFKQPYVFKTLFTGEPIHFRDICVTKQVKNGGAMYLRFPEGDLNVIPKKDEALPVDELAEADPNYGGTHVGRSGSFVPVKEGNYKDLVGGELVVVRKGKASAVQGTKGYLWVESEMIRQTCGDAIDRLVFERLEDAVEGTGSITDFVDMAYFAQLAEDAAQSIEKFCEGSSFQNYEAFVSA